MIAHEEYRVFAVADLPRRTTSKPPRLTALPQRLGILMMTFRLPTDVDLSGLREVPFSA
jgi:hypothetical protein